MHWYILIIFAFNITIIVRFFNIRWGRGWRNKMPMLMIQCKTCGEVFPGLYVEEGSNDAFKATATNANTSHTCSRGHKNEYVTVDYMDWSTQE